MLDSDPIPNRGPKEIAFTPLPFTYIQTNDRSKAEIVDFGYAFQMGNQSQKVRTMEEVLTTVKRKKENKHWYTNADWRMKGIPQEQIEIQIDGKTITVFNYNQETPFTDEHMAKAVTILQKMASSFPQILDETRWILIDNLSELSAFGDPDKYSVSGTCMRQWNAFRMYPRGMSFAPHRIETSTNFEGTLGHELSHLLEKEFVAEWSEKFSWGYCGDYPDEWEARPSPDGKSTKFYNKKTGEMVPNFQFPNEPEQCVNYYAKINMGEDIAESIACYLLDPERLKRISPAKFEIISKHDQKLNLPTSKTLRVAKEEINIPQPQPETVYYYIVQPDKKPIQLPSPQELSSLPSERLERILIDIIKEQMETINDTGEKVDTRRKELAEIEQIILNKLPSQKTEPSKPDRITKLLIESNQRKIEGGTIK